MFKKALKATGRAFACGFILMGYSLLPIPTESYAEDLRTLEVSEEVTETVAR